MASFLQDLETLRTVATVIGIIGLCAVSFVWGWASRDKEGQR